MKISAYLLSLGFLITSFAQVAQAATSSPELDILLGEIRGRLRNQHLEVTVKGNSRKECTKALIKSIVEHKMPEIERPEDIKREKLLVEEIGVQFSFKTKKGKFKGLMFPSFIENEDNTMTCHVNNEACDELPVFSLYKGKQTYFLSTPILEIKTNRNLKYCLEYERVHPESRDHDLDLWDIF